jgi:hypothetical protein
MQTSSAGPRDSDPLSITTADLTRVAGDGPLPAVALTDI